MRASQGGQWPLAAVQQRGDLTSTGRRWQTGATPNRHPLPVSFPGGCTPGTPGSPPCTRARKAGRFRFGAACPAPIPA